MFKKIKLIISTILILALLLAGCTNKTKQLTIENQKNTNEIKQLNIPNSREIIQNLCSDELEGRLLGSDGNKLAEEYIYNLFSLLKLEPVFDDSYYAPYTYKTTAEHDTRITFDKQANNLVGKITGTNNKNALIISAHLDHIGIRNGKIIKGAIDNASGVAVLINLADELKKQSNKIKFDYDIVFAVFNGEEVGMTGSKSFVSQIGKIYDNFYNINIDSVGYKNTSSVVLNNSFNNLRGLSNNNDFNKLYTNLKIHFENNNLTISRKKLPYLGSDDYSFQEKGYPAIGIIEENVKDIIHTPNDTPEMIDYSRLELIKKSIYSFIINSGDCLFK
ncbi:M28 family peptidase [Clostridium peptidivorans]|uniref:M28 family peptidase n=1 Tax=Clostridium peptidivorans TaxID=100174 RepID=UPI0015C833A0|nr:M28 family peptidase [Clostridium peptidivorans]